MVIVRLVVNSSTSTVTHPPVHKYYNFKSKKYESTTTVTQVSKSSRLHSGGGLLEAKVLP